MVMVHGKILIVEDELNLRRVLQAQLEHMEYKVSVADDVREAYQMLEADSYGLVLTDLSLPGESGLELLKTVHREYPDTTVILMTAFGSVETAVEAMKSGAYDYLTKPLHPYELRILVERVFERKRLVQEVQTLRSNIDRKYGFENILGKSKSLLHVLDAAAHVAPTDATVLIRGETGTGKELLAKAVHLNSPRREKPFVVINCGAIPRELLESELFGHTRGSFTGALAHKKGKMEIAEGGTVFLDEIGEMPLDLQIRILRVVQEREIEKIGAMQPVKVDVRILAATHRNLEELVSAGIFREDLYYRLSVVPLFLPPLRDRRDDIPELVHEFFELSKRKHGRPNLKFSPVLIPYFVNYSWPGNVRELENAVARMVLLARSDTLGVGDLPGFLNRPVPAPGPRNLPLVEGTAGLNAIERAAIVDALEKAGGNQSRAARELGITRKVLMNRITKYQINVTELAEMREQDRKEA